MTNSLVKRVGLALGLAAGLAGVSGCGMAMGTVAGFQRTPNDAFMVAAIGNTADNARRGNNGQRKSVKDFDYGKGFIFTGEVDSRLLPCKGRMIYPTGDIYEGEFLNKKRHGYGKYIYNKGGNIEEGYWENDDFRGNQPTSKR